MKKQIIMTALGDGFFSIWMELFCDEQEIRFALIKAFPGTNLNCNDANGCVKVENIVYNELLIRGYNVDVGIVEVYAKNDEGKTTRKQFEVDFVVNQGSQRYYIQVAYDMTSEEKQKQEFNSFRNIPDSFKKIVVVNGTKKPWRNEEGFVIMGMKYFLLNADSLEF